LASRWFNARRAMAVHLLGDLRHPEAYAMLMALAERRGDKWRPVAIRALGLLGDERAVAALRSFDGDVEEDVKYALDLLT
jgi:HEAT repeat protein